MRVFRIPFEAMASSHEVVVAAADEAAAQRFARVAVAEVQRIEHKYSRYRESSIVSRINAAAGSATPVTVDAETQSLLDHAQTLYQHSDGLFDISSGVLRRVWDFKAARRPSAAALAEVLTLIGWPQVERQPGQVRLPRAGMEIDFGGFGKEYAADRAAVLMAQAGATHGYVNLAGDMRFIGPRPDGTPWQIGIQHPRRRGELIATLPCSTGGLATSGDYERYFDLDGQRYCHVLNPRSGQPVRHWQSVSVLAPLASLAGCCSTIAMLKEADGLAFLEAAAVSYLAVDAQGELHVRSAPAQPTANTPTASQSTGAGATSSRIS
jgi:FAD:protein FMN transferase